MAVAIIGTIRTMGLPVPESREGWQPRETRGHTPGPEAVRIVLISDENLHDEIVDRIEVEFWRAVERGSITSVADRPLVFRIVQCVAWRLASKRARQLLRTVRPSSEEDTTGDLPSEDPTPEETIATAEMRERLGRALANLSEADRRLLLEGKVGEGYGDLATELGVDVGTLRVRACRLWKRVRAEVLGVEEAA